MPTVEFHGQVLPAGRTMNCPSFPMAYAGDDGLSAAMKLEIVASKVKVTCEIKSPGQNTFNDLYVASMRMTRAVVDVAAFHEGMAWTVVLEDYVDEAEHVRKITLKDPTLAGLNTAFNTASDVDWAIRLAITEPEVGRLLHDLVQANAFPDDSVRNGYRAIEAVRHLLVPGHGDNDRRAAWDVVRTTLNIDEDYIRYVAVAAKDPRHGKVGAMPGGLCQECLRRAWLIVARFLEYRRRGNAPLPESAFPILRA